VPHAGLGGRDDDPGHLGGQEGRQDDATGDAGGQEGSLGARGPWGRIAQGSFAAVVVGRLSGVPRYRVTWMAAEDEKYPIFPFGARPGNVNRRGEISGIARRGNSVSFGSFRPAAGRAPSPYREGPRSRTCT
jgi:hypothetical protein